jgi:hypothetical protein
LKRISSHRGIEMYERKDGRRSLYVTAHPGGATVRRHAVDGDIADPDCLATAVYLRDRLRRRMRNGETIRRQARRADTQAHPVGPGVYLIAAVNGNSVSALKIGLTLCVASRLRTLRNSSPLPLALEGWLQCDTIRSAESLERELHLQFCAHRMHGEWFRSDLSIYDRFRAPAQIVTA